MPGRDWGRKKKDALTVCLVLESLLDRFWEGTVDTGVLLGGLVCRT